MQHHDPVGTPEGESEGAPDALKNRLSLAENVLATLSVDLDGELRFTAGLLALTDRRLMARDAGGTWSEWSLPAPGLELHLGDHAGIGTLDLLGAQGRLARWRYTLAQQPAALRFQKLFEQQAAGVAQVTAGPKLPTSMMQRRLSLNSRRHRQPGCCCGWGALPNPIASS